MRAEVIEDLRERIRSGGSSFSPTQADRELVRLYYKQITGRIFTRTRCGDCIRDALTEMAAAYRNDMELEQTLFELRAGAIVRTDGVGVMSFKNLSNDLALRHLMACAEQGDTAVAHFRSRFSVFPSDDELEELLAPYLQEARRIQAAATKAAKEAEEKTVKEAEEKAAKKAAAKAKELETKKAKAAEAKAKEAETKPAE